MSIRVNALQAMMLRDIGMISDVLQAGYDEDTAPTLLARVIVANEIDMAALIGAVERRRT